MRPYTRTMTALSNDADGYVDAETTGGAGNLTLDGALTSGGVGTAAEAQKVSIGSAGNVSAVTFTVTGTDAEGFTISEDVTGPNATTVHSSKYFKTVTQIAVDGAVASAVDIGPLQAQGGVLDLKPVDWRNADDGASIFVDVGSTVNYSVQYTLSDPQLGGDAAFWMDKWDMILNSDGSTGDATLAGDAYGSFTLPVQAIRIKVNSSTAGTLSYQFLQP